MVISITIRFLVLALWPLLCSVDRISKRLPNSVIWMRKNSICRRTLNREGLFCSGITIIAPDKGRLTYIIFKPSESGSFRLAGHLQQTIIRLGDVNDVRLILGFVTECSLNFPRNFR
ncbi:hypothetical protein V1527DRAFT_472713 [Lipomyces starkeyi]